MLHNLAGQYQGLIFPVNPFRRSVQGSVAFPSVDRLPSKPDLAIVATPAHTIPQIIEECGKASVPSVIIVSAGFDENDSAGKELTQQILELRREYGVRIIGPNSFGIIRPRANLYATFGEKKVTPGKIAFISQSAALCGSILDWSSETKVGLSAVVSTGTSLDVDISDLIDYFGEDPQTRTIMLYFEDLKNIRRFMSAARGFARTKPIVLVKADRFSKNPNLSAVGLNRFSEEDRTFAAAFRRIGVVRVDTITELFNCGKALSMQPNPTEKCLTVVTNASGPGLMAVDELKSRGGELSKTSSGTTETLKNILPYYCNVSNPIDVLEEATPERFKQVLQVCLDDPTVKSLLIIYTSLGATDPSCIASIAMELRAQKRKTLLVCIMGEDASCQEARRLLNQNSIPAFRTPEAAVSTFMYMYTYTRNLELLYQTPEELPLPSNVPVHLKGSIRRAFCEGKQCLSLTEALSFLEAYGIPTLKSHIAQTAEQAISLANEVGYPITLRALTTQSPSKSKKENGSFDVCSSSEVETAFNKIAESMRTIDSEQFQGVIIQPKLRTKGFDLFVGSKKDSKFGSLILFGIGGTAKTYDEEVSIGFPPLNYILAGQIVDYSKTARHTEAWFRSLNSSKAGPIEETLVKLSQLVIDFPEIKEVNVDPLVLDEKGICAVSASVTIDRDRIMREAADHYEHLIISPYPKKYVTRTTLKNGFQIKLRPIKPEDENRFNDLFKSLSEESIRFRFFETIKELSHDTLTRYCNLDYDREIAIVAELQNDGRIIGVARIIPDVTGKSGEFALMVGDAWHGFGLGMKLMELISDIARDLKLETIHSYVARANTKMINLCVKKGFIMKPIDEYAINMSKSFSP